MNYQETLDYLFTQLPMYQRVGKAAYKADLSNTFSLCELLGHPEKKFKSIHIAGTNGKGSTSHMIASILQEAGYKVGLYTSPHLKDFRERIRINGKKIQEKEVVEFVDLYQAQFENIHLSFFEWTVGLAFDYFATQKVDIAVIETGLGGRLDSTNVVIPEMTIITNIGIDHTQFLGNSLEAIAIEKGGIIKTNIPIVIGETQLETKPIFTKIANELNAPIIFADNEQVKKYSTDLKGNYQTKNLQTCVVAIQNLKTNGWIISEENIEMGLLSVVKNTGILGRWQMLGESPKIICDTGHNKEGIREIIDQLLNLEHDKLHIVFGTVNDKSLEGILELLPKHAVYYFCKADIPRALSVNELHKMASNLNLIGEVYGSVIEAYNSAKGNASENDVIFIGGSTFVVAEVL